jgi:hypothetical protein
MKAKCAGFLLLLSCATAFGQEQPGGKFYGPFSNGTLPKDFRLRPPLGMQLQSMMKRLASRCSVPLLEAHVTEPEPPGGRITPRLENVAPMPPARVPAPACEPSSK